MRKTRTISQKEARRLRALVTKLEREENQRRLSWATDWPGGTYLGRLTLTQDHRIVVASLIAKRLGHAVVIAVNEPHLEVYALPLGVPS